MNSDSQVLIIAFSKRGHQVADYIEKQIHQAFHPEEIRHMGTEDLKAHGGLENCLLEAFQKENTVIIFISAVGIAVRAISKALKDKLTDPPVIVIDDHGHYVISLLSGHMGGANALTLELSDLLKPHYMAEPVITTATDLNGCQGIEPLFKTFRVNAHKHRHLIKKYNLHLANGGSVGVFIDPKIRLKAETLSPYKSPQKQWCIYQSPLKWYAHDGLKLLITLREATAYLDPAFLEDADTLISQSLVLGTGCKKNLPIALYQKNLKEALLDYDYLPESIACIASIHLKKDEKCLLATGEALKVKRHFFSVKSLLQYESAFKGSSFVKETTGIVAVAGPCAYHLTQDSDCYHTLKYQGTTFAFGRILL